MSLLPAIERALPGSLDWCRFCSREKVVAVCDWGEYEKKTCSKRVCHECGISPGANVHFCPDHNKNHGAPPIEKVLA